MNSLPVSIQSAENLQILKRLNFCSYSDSPEALIAFTYSQHPLIRTLKGPENLFELTNVRKI